MLFTRNPQNPLIKPSDVKPSRPDFEVIGAFNAGVTRYKDEVILLLRVAERPLNTDSAWTAYPFMDKNGDISIRRVPRNDARYNLSDSRLIFDTQTEQVLLTSISHIRLAHSKDGVHFGIDVQPWLMPMPPYENFGMEDPRVTLIDDTYYINYSAVSPLGISTGLLTTRDFVTVERSGIMFPPANRDVTLFPTRIGGDYVCYHRPMPGTLGSLNIWLARSTDLKRWGDHQLVLQGSPTGWENGRVGGGAPPLLTDRGWLSIYHAADRQQRYCLGFFITPEDDPKRVILQSSEPILSPEASYETHGFFGNVVFTCGALLDGDILRIYYGAADESIALAEAKLEDIFALARTI
ncbi:MAG: glycoside hydrolase family 130 protein [Chloroflexota bacterium]